MTLVAELVRTLALVAAMALALPALAQSPDYSLLTYTGADRLDRIVAAAKKEATLTLYTTFAEKDIAPLVGPFEKKYGIKVIVWRAGTDKVLQRTLAEYSAKRYEVDVVHFGTPEMEALHREKVLQPVASPHHADLVPGSIPAHREWAATLLSVWVQAYNTEKVRKEDLPKTYAELLGPKWKDKIGIEAKNLDWFAETVLGMGGEDKGLEFWRELVAKNGISVRQGHTLLNNMVVSGEVPLALTVYNYMPEQAKKRGAPIDWFVIEPAIARTNGVGIAKRAPHPAAALLFYDYWLSEAQPLMVGMDYVPSNRKVKSPIGDIKVKLVDPVESLDQAEKWSGIFQNIMVKRSR